MSVSKFTNASGRPLTQSLFYETCPYNGDREAIVYTLKDEDHKGYPSLYRLYMECGDLTEYEFAQKNLAGWAHWQMLCGADWFQPFVTRWRQELELRVKAKALRILQEEAGSEGKNAFSANRFLVEGGWLPKAETKKAGRPSKERIRMEAAALLDNEKAILADHDRLN